MSKRQSLSHPSKPILVHISTADIIALDELAIKRGLSRSNLVRNGVSALLALENKSATVKRNSIPSEINRDIDLAWQRIIDSMGD
jgi:hypothetical protein